MLRSIARHFNDTVFRGPDDEGLNSAGEADTLDTGAPDSGEAPDEGSEPEPQERLTVREQIKASIAETREEPSATREKKVRNSKTGRFDKGAEAAPVETAPVETVAPVATIPAPESLPKEAKAEWDKAPEAVKAAFVKREQDMAAGVAQLQQRYSLIDQAIEPHTDALRKMNATPAEAVNRMFLWFGALAGSPDKAFPALAQSMGLDWGKITGGQTPAAPVDPNQPAPTGAAPEIPEPVKQYIGKMEGAIQQLTDQLNQLGGQIAPIQQNIDVQNKARTQENLTLWSKDKPHFEDVRVDMANFLQSGIIPLKDGQVDLDTAYERAIHFNPEVRAKVLAEQQQANLQVQQQSKDAATTAQKTQVEKARKAAVSIPASTTPNGQPPLVKKKSGAKLSVRDSLKAAMAELRDQ